VWARRALVEDVKNVIGYLVRDMSG
jgi:hypothetical protein